MGKKLTLLAMAVAAVAALAAPPSASAITLSDSKEAQIKPGTALNATNIGPVVIKNLPEGIEGGTMTCASVELHPEVVEDSGSEVAVTGSGGTTEECIQTNEFEEESEVSVSNIEYALSSTEATMGTGEVALAFQIEFPTIELTCSYTGLGTFSYTTGTDEITIDELPLTGSPANPCENQEATTTFEASFTLETPDQTPVYITP